MLPNLYPPHRNALQLQNATGANMPQREGARLLQKPHRSSSTRVNRTVPHADPRYTSNASHVPDPKRNREYEMRQPRVQVDRYEHEAELLQGSSQPSSETGHRTGAYAGTRYTHNASHGLDAKRNYREHELRQPRLQVEPEAELVQRPSRSASAMGHRTVDARHKNNAFHVQGPKLNYWGHEMQQPPFQAGGTEPGAEQLQRSRPSSATGHRTIAQAIARPIKNVIHNLHNRGNESRQPKRGRSEPVPQPVQEEESSLHSLSRTKRFMRNLSSTISLVTSLNGEKEEPKVAELVAENDSLREHVNMQARQIQTMSQQMQMDPGAFQDLQERYVSTVDLLDARTRELKVAQQFLTTADPIAEADVIRLVESLNNDIMQFASRLAESIPHKNRRRGTKYQFAEVPGIRDIDTIIQRLLYDSRQVADPALAVQISIQAYFVSSCSRTIHSWHPDEQHDEVFKDLYEQMQRTVAPQIAGKWRTLTKACLHKLPSGAKKPAPQTLADKFKSDLSQILKIAGYQFDLDRIWTTDCMIHLQSLAESVLELRGTIGEKLSSSELEVFFHRSGITLDPKAMEDGFNPKSRWAHSGIVLCTTDLGVQRLHSRNEGVTVLLKCKVALEYIRMDALPTVWTGSSP